MVSATSGVDLPSSGLTAGRTGSVPDRTALEAEWSALLQSSTAPDASALETWMAEVRARIAENRRALLSRREAVESERNTAQQRLDQLRQAERELEQTRESVELIGLRVEVSFLGLLPESRNRWPQLAADLLTPDDLTFIELFNGVLSRETQDLLAGRIAVRLRHRLVSASSGWAADLVSVLEPELAAMVATTSYQLQVLELSPAWDRLLRTRLEKLGDYLPSCWKSVTWDALRDASSRPGDLRERSLAALGDAIHDYLRKEPPTERLKVDLEAAFQRHFQDLNDFIQYHVRAAQETLQRLGTETEALEAEARLLDEAEAHLATLRASAPATPVISEAPAIPEPAALPSCPGFIIEGIAMEPATTVPAAAPAAAPPAAEPAAPSGNGAAAPAFGSFLDFKRCLLNVTADLQRLRGYCQKLNLTKSLELTEDVLKRIEGDKFSVAIVGEFKRGKSTFINALLGREILPSDILPTTATLNRVTYGLKPMVRVYFKDGREEEVGIDQLSNFVTKLTLESEQNAASVREAVVYYPVHYCQNSVDIIDTPGLNDDESMTEVTLGVLPKVDAAILVIMAQSPFSEYEREFLEKKLLTNDLGRVIFVVTAIDRCDTPEQADRVVQHIKQRIYQYVIKRASEAYGKDSEEFQVYMRKIGEPKVFGLSPKQALTAKTTNNQELLATSKFMQFEKTLETFLTQDRGAIFLQVPVNRLLSSCQELAQAVTLREGALEMKEDEFTSAYEKSVAEIEGLRKKQTAELRKIDAAATRVRGAIQPLLLQMESEMQEAAVQAIDAADVDRDELNRDREGVQAKLAAAVSSSVQNVSQRLAERIQNEVQKGIASEIDRLKAFSDELAEALRRIEVQFSGIPAGGGSGGPNTTGEGVAAAVAVFTGLGGIWSGYKEAGMKGAVTGGVASIGTALGAGMIAAVIGLPFTLPIAIAVGVISIFTGKALTQAIFGREVVENFKESYKKAVLEQMQQELQANPLQRKVDEHVSAAFDALKGKVQKEVDAMLDDTQDTLAELRGKRERNEMMTENEREELSEIRTEINRISENAKALNDQLMRVLTA